ncbi:blood vessel epicardial substance-like isoform X1 [Centruroides sculpturatus]|uniref:blood vessel epicardial substance-like isoform X1 n=1 Tax=Centruroides sculpturatus TaxID=218467 RepID=UPI000C6EA9D4|nr:blood vessel epicardial substance-like isoform X1 [Centruroides sculpturatus]
MVIQDIQTAIQKALNEALKNRRVQGTANDGVREVFYVFKVTNSALENVTTTNHTEDDYYCEEWSDAKHVLFQSANLCYAAAFLVPHNFTFSILIKRIMLTVGFLMVTLWAGVDVCAPDIFAWNLTFVLTNCVHSFYLAYKNIPPRIDPELMDLFNKVFIPLKVNKKNYKQLIKEAEILSVDEDEHYAIEGITSADERLSILLSGRMKATCEDVLLHYINPNEFIDSPEWEACPTDSDKLFQVTVTALEPCRLLCWQRRRIRQVLKNNQFLDIIMYNLIGKDITHKLYSLNEFHRPENRTLLSDPNDWWRHPIPRSLSVDAVHTGTKGHVRSLLWRAQNRRASSAPSDSIGSSPARTSRYSAYCSDPGPFRSPCRPSPIRVVSTALDINSNTSIDESSAASFKTDEGHLPGRVSFETSV